MLLFKWHCIRQHCTFIYTHTYMQPQITTNTTTPYTELNTHTQHNTHMHTDYNTHTPQCTQTHHNTHTPQCTQTHHNTHKHTTMYTHTHTHTPQQTYTNTDHSLYIHTHTCMHAHTHTRTHHTAKHTHKQVLYPPTYCFSSACAPWGWRPQRSTWSKGSLSHWGGRAPDAGSPSETAASASPSPGPSGPSASTHSMSGTSMVIFNNTLDSFHLFFLFFLWQQCNFCVCVVFNPKWGSSVTDVRYTFIWQFPHPANRTSLSQSQARGLATIVAQMSRARFQDRYSTPSCRTYCRKLRWVIMYCNTATMVRVIITAQRITPSSPTLSKCIKYL